MPEYPDITVYVEALEARLAGAVLHAFRLFNPFLLRTVDPAPEALVGRKVLGLRRLGKRIVFALEDEYFLVLHLMIAGRLHWQPGTPKRSNKAVLARLAFTPGHLAITEAGSQRRASLHVFYGDDDLRRLDPGGLEVFDANLDDFALRLIRENHTLKRALTDPRLFSGIGNAYSDEILHRARLSPMQLTRNLSEEQIATLYGAVRETLIEWTDRLRREAGGAFPTNVTAFRPDMAVHGRYGLPCPVCGTTIQRIVYGEHETHYCPGCQTEGRVLADRSLSRLMKDDWPRTIQELEERMGPAPGGADAGRAGFMARRPPHSRRHPSNGDPPS